MKQYTVQDDTGKEITFDWEDPTPPTDSDFEEVFKQAETFKPEPVPTPEYKVPFVSELPEQQKILPTVAEEITAPNQPYQTFEQPKVELPRQITKGAMSKTTGGYGILGTPRQPQISTQEFPEQSITPMPESEVAKFARTQTQPYIPGQLSVPTFGVESREAESTARMYAGGIARRAGEKLQQVGPELQPDVIERGRQLAESIGLTPDKIKGFGTVSTKLSQSLPENWSDEDKQAAYSYGVSVLQGKQKALGAKEEEFGKAQVTKAFEVDPAWLKADRIRDDITKLEKTDPGIVRSWKKGDLSLGIDQMVFDVAMSGDEEAFNQIANVKTDYQNTYMKMTDEEGKKGWVEKNVHAVAEMLPGMTKGAALSAIPGIGTALGQSYWARQGGGDIIYQAIKRGVPLKDAIPMGIGGGLVYAAIEGSQVGKLSTLNPFLKGVLTNKVASFLISRPLEALDQSLEEGAQQISTDLSVMNAMKAAGITVDQKKEFENALKDGFMAFKQSLVPMTALGFLGTVKGGIKLARQPKGGPYAEGIGISPKEAGPKEGPGGGTGGPIRLRDDEKARLEAEAGKARSAAVVSEVAGLSDAEIKQLLLRAKIPEADISKLTLDEQAEIADKELFRQKQAQKTSQQEPSLYQQQQPTDENRATGEAVAKKYGFSFKEAIAGDRDKGGVQLSFNDPVTGNDVTVSAGNADAEAARIAEKSRMEKPHEYGKKIGETAGVEYVGREERITKALGASGTYATEMRAKYRTPLGNEFTVPNTVGADEVKIRAEEMDKKGAPSLPEKVQGREAEGDEYIYHNTGIDKLKEIRKEGLDPQYANEYPHGLGDEYDKIKRIYFASHEKGAKEFGAPTGGNVLRVKKSYLDKSKLHDVKHSGASGGTETRYSGKIPPEQIEIKINNEWYPLKEQTDEQEVQKGRQEEVVPVITPVVRQNPDTDRMLKMYVTTGKTETTLGKATHEKLVQVFDQVAPEDIAEVAGISLAEAREAIGDIRALQKTPIAKKVRQALAPSLFYGESVDETVKGIQQPRAKGGEVMFSREGKLTPAVKIGDRIFTGLNHGDALNNAIKAGVIKSHSLTVEDKAKSNYNLWVTEDGMVIDREQGGKEYGLYTSEGADNEGRLTTENRPLEPVQKEEQFVRASTKKEDHIDSAKRAGFNSIPDKAGYEKVYKPYGEQGAGFYYSKKIEPSQPLQLQREERSMDLETARNTATDNGIEYVTSTPAKGGPFYTFRDPRTGTEFNARTPGEVRRATGDLVDRIAPRGTTKAGEGVRYQLEELGDRELQERAAQREADFKRLSEEGLIKDSPKLIAYEELLKKQMAFFEKNGYIYSEETKQYVKDTPENVSRYWSSLGRDERTTPREDVGYTPFSKTSEAPREEPPAEVKFSREEEPVTYSESLKGKEGIPKDQDKNYNRALEDIEFFGKKPKGISDKSRKELEQAGYQVPKGGMEPVRYVFAEKETEEAGVPVSNRETVYPKAGDYGEIPEKVTREEPEVIYDTGTEADKARGQAIADQLGNVKFAGVWKGFRSKDGTLHSDPQLTFVIYDSKGEHGTTILAPLDTTAGHVAKRRLDALRGDVKYQIEEAKQTVDPFFSPTVKAVQGLKQERGTGDQMFAMITKTPGVKEAEWKWMGLDDFLKGKQSVTKTEIEEFVRQNQVSIEEVKKGKKDPIDLKNKKAQLNKLGDEWDILAEEDGKWWPLQEGYISVNEAKTAEEALSRYKKDHKYDDTKFSQYSLPGGENYREVLLKIPGAKFVSSHWPDDPGTFAHVRLDDRTGPNGEKVLFVEEIQSDWAREAREKGISGSVTIPEGKIYQDSKYPERWRAKSVSDQTIWFDSKGEAEKYLQNKGVPAQPFLKNWEELTLKRVLRMAAEEGYDRVAWISGAQTADRYDLSKQVSKVVYQPESKRLIVYGDTGNQMMDEVVEPNDIEKHIGKEPARRLLEQPVNDKTGWMVEEKDGGWSVKKPDGSYYETGPGKGKWAGQKHQAESIIKRNAGVAEQSIEGEDLKIGGEWAANLYDKMIPKFYEKYGKRWNTKVEPIEITSLERDPRFRKSTVHSNYKKYWLEYDGKRIGGEYNTAIDAMNQQDQRYEKQMSIAITPEMKKSVLYEGQPMFQKEGQREPTSLRREEPTALSETPGRNLPSKDSEVGNAVPENVSAVVALTGAIEKSFGTTLPEGSITAVDAPQEEVYQVADRLISEEFGRTPVWFGVSREAEDAGVRIGGARMPGRPNEVFINTKTKKPVIVTAVHETMHVMQESNPDLYYPVLETMIEQATPEFAAYRQRMIDKGYTEQEVMDEMVAEISGERFTDPEFLQALHERSPDAFRTFVETLRRVIQQIKDWIRKSGIEHAGKYFVDLNRVDRVLQDSLIEMRRRGQPEMRMAAQREVRLQREQTKTEAFQNWFKGSKVVDKNGEPLVVYHGGGAIISDFSHGTRRGVLGVAYFTDSNKVALKYAIGGGIDNELSLVDYRRRQLAELPNRTPVVLRAYIRIKNPADLDNMEWDDAEKIYGGKNKLAAALADFSYDTYQNQRDYFEKDKDNDGKNFKDYWTENAARLIDFSDFDLQTDGYDDKSLNEASDAVKFLYYTGMLDSERLGSIGYDGAVFSDAESGANTYVVFSPTQIKSATGNRGTFDASNPDIRFSREEKEPAYKVIDKRAAHVTKEELPAIYKEAKTFDSKTTAERLKKRFGIKKQSMALARYLGRTVSGTLLEISPVIRDALQKQVNRVMIDTAKANRRVLPLVKAISKMPEEDAKVFDIAAKNADSEKINELAGKYGFRDALDEYRKIMDEIVTRAREAGYETGYLKDYFPRMPKDRDAYRNYIRGLPEWGQIEEAMREKSKSVGHDLNEDEQAEFLNLYIRGYGNKMSGTPGQLKERTIKYLDNEMNALLEDTRLAIPLYVEGMIKKIARKEFFGNKKETDELYINDIDQSIGDYVADQIRKKNLDPVKQDQLVGLLKSYFNYKPTNRTIAVFKNLGYAASMGSGFSSMFSQMQDAAFGFYTAPGSEAGAIIRSLLGKNEISIKDLGIDDIAAEFRDPGKLAQFVDKLLRGVGLKYGDSVFKNAFLNANLKKYRSMAKSGKINTDFRNDLDSIFGAEAESVIADLKSGVDSDNVKVLMLNQISKFQPTTLLQVPQAYLDAPRGRIAYALKTYQINQFNAIIDESIRAMNGAKDLKAFGRAFGRIAGVTAMLMAAGVGTDRLKDFLFRRQCTWGQYTVDNILKLMFISRYVTWQAREQGLYSAIVKLVAPPMSWMDYIGKDINKAISKPEDFKLKDMESIRILPVIGQEFYWWTGGGHEKQLKQAVRKSEPKKFSRELNKIKTKADKVYAKGDTAKARELQQKAVEYREANKAKVGEYYEKELKKEMPRNYNYIIQNTRTDTIVDSKKRYKAMQMFKKMTPGQQALVAKYKRELDKESE